MVCYLFFIETMRTATNSRIKRTFTIERRKVYKHPTVFSKPHLEFLKIVGYGQGNKIDKCKYLSVYDFDSISFVQESINPINQQKFTHCWGIRNNKPYFLVMQ